MPHLAVPNHAMRNHALPHHSMPHHAVSHHAMPHQFGRKKIFFTVLYRSPASDHNSPNFQVFLSKFSNLQAKIKAESPFTTIFTGDFNAHSQFWWPDGDTTPEGTEIEHLLTSLGLSQIISEPTNFETNKKPSYHN